VTVIYQSDCARLTVYESPGNGAPESMAEEIRQGLSGERKSVPCKYFYDDAGSRLFERICNLPEYYQTRLEMGLLNKYGPQIMSGFSHGDIVELGSGANWKIKRLITSIGRRNRAGLRYVPVDISHSALIDASSDMLELYPDMNIMGIVTDFTRNLDRLEKDRPKLILFLGGTIGNLDENEAQEFLECVAGSMRGDDRFLLGADMIKPVTILEAAYNDSAGVTGLFNKNILKVINRELDADFDHTLFAHRAFYDQRFERVEMHLEAREDMEVNIPGAGIEVEIVSGETIRTEICRKFSRASLVRMVRSAGLEVDRWYSNDDRWFSLVELVKR